MKPLLYLRTAAGLALAALVSSVAAAAPSAETLLDQAREAAGGAAWQQVAALQAQGHIESSQMPGQWTRVDDVRQGRWQYRVDVGVHRFAEGDDGVSPAWRQDRSGGVHRLDSRYAKAHQASDRWLVRHGWLLPQAGGATLGAVREDKADGQPYWVLTAEPPQGNRVELWFDPRSHLLNRTVQRMPTASATELYADYRRVGELQLPYRIEQRSTETTDVDLITVKQWAVVDAPPPADFAMPPQPDDHTIDGDSTTVPMEVEPYPAIPVRVNGQPMVFLLDTGGHNILTPEAAHALGLKTVGQGASGGAGEGETALQYTRVDKLEIGKAVLRDQHFYVMPFAYATVERGAKPVLGGMLGLELFERFLVRLDYPGKTLTLRRFPSADYRGPGVQVPIQFFDDMPLLEGRIDGQPGLLALDTGNGGTTVVQQQWAREHGLADKLKAGIETVSFGQGGASRNWVSRGQSIDVAGVHLPSPQLRYAEDKAGAFASITEAANIGSDVLSHFVLEVDYSHHRIWFDHRPGAFTPMPFTRAGLRAMKTSPEVIQAIVVTPGGPAAAAGVAPGDEIVRVDGTPVNTVSGYDFNQKMAQAPGTVLTLGVRRDGVVRDIAVKLRELLP